MDIIAGYSNVPGETPLLHLERTTKATISLLLPKSNAPLVLTISQKLLKGCAILEMHDLIVPLYQESKEEVVWRVQC